MTNNKVLVPMCKKCLDAYEWDMPAFRVYGVKCDSCGNPCVTVGLLSGEMIDRLNKEAKDEL